MKISHRDRIRLLGGAAAYAVVNWISGTAFLSTAFAQNKKKVLKVVLTPEPPSLVTAFNSAVMVQQISPKMMDGLLAYDRDMNPVASLATAWETAGDGLSIRFNLRPGVKWHDGKPFTSADVKYSIEEILKKHHPRGRSTFGNVTSVETPDDLTAIVELSKPSLYIMAALSASESPMLPKHLYDVGSEPPNNPLINAPIGTGPFKFVEWQRGRYLKLERNTDYWTKGKPFVDEIIVRFIPDSGARAVSFETGEIQVGGSDPVPLSDLERLKSVPKLNVTTDGYAMCGAMFYFEFNMRDPQFQDLRVRQAIAHAIDREFVVRNVWVGYGDVATGPISQKLKNFYSADVPKYPFDTAKAEVLLDQAGFPRRQRGFRFKITHDPSGYFEQYRRFGEYFKQAMRKIGIDVDLRSPDPATWQRRVYTDNDYQTSSYGIFNTSDPTIGVQRMYWSKNIRKGVPYSNGSGYSNPEMDVLLESGQTEASADARRAIFAKMQTLAMKDLPIIPILNVNYTTVYSSDVKNLGDDIEGFFGTFANVDLSS